MSKQQETQNLDVFLHGKYIGKLSSRNAILSFIYDEVYLLRSDAAKLSSSMPLQKEPFNHQIASAFFSGLLPDAYVRKRLAQYLGLSEKNTFALLKAIGGECAGAISIQPEGAYFKAGNSPSYLILDNRQAHEILSQIDKRPMMAGEEDIRISGAGAQDKVMVALVNGKVAIPRHNTPSTHIIKPAIKDIEGSVHNEFFCMKLAKLIGLPVPNVSIQWLEGEPYYLIERYDRRSEQEGVVIRLHQEDFCQAMHIPPEHKYENEGGPTPEQCFSLLDTHIKSGVMAGKNKVLMLQAIIFNFLIGNGDAHGKNFSIFYDGEEERLAPFYDLMSTLIYSNAFKARMAMKLGGKYKFQEISMRHFESLEEITGFRPDFIRKQIHQLSKEVLKASLSLVDDLNRKPETSSAVYENILQVIHKHCQQIY